jgi:hypothetical protein
VSLVSDIPAGDGNIEKLFYGVVQHFGFSSGADFFFSRKIFNRVGNTALERPSKGMEN